MQSNSEMERAKEAPAQLRCRLRKIRLRTHRFSEAWGPTMCLNAEERFQLKERLLCWGGFARTISRGGDVCLIERGLGGVARSFAAGALGTL